MGHWHQNKKKFARPSLLTLGEELFQWYKGIKSSAINAPVSRAVIQAKAESIARTHKIEDFKVSSGWLSNFQKRHNLTSQNICGEANKVHEESASSWLMYFNERKSKYTPRNIFNMDGCGIFYNMFPNRTLNMKGEKCHGGEGSKERLPAVFVCNMDGSQKDKVWIIGKYEKSHCLKNLDRKALPCEYSHQSNAWIDSRSFRMWLMKFNDKMSS